MRGPFVCYWRSERASRPDSASVEGSGVGGGGVGFGDAGLDVSMPDAAIDLRTVCGVTVDGFDLVLELIPQVSDSAITSSPSLCSDGLLYVGPFHN